MYKTWNKLLVYSFLFKPWVLEKIRISCCKVQNGFQFGSICVDIKYL